MRAENSLKKNSILVGALIALILLVDQAVKIYIKTTFAPGETQSIFGDWFLLQYTENQGMAFGTTFGNKIWHKLALSIFRVVAISALIYYWFKQAKQDAHRGFLITLGLIIAGATGNLIDSICYDYVFPYDPCFPYNQLEGSGNLVDCGFFEIETKFRGVLLGNVVDMFKFEAFWPEWMPWIGGSEVFPAIWNIADAAISIGIILIFFNQKRFFSKRNEVSVSAEVEQSEETQN